MNEAVVVAQRAHDLEDAASLYAKAFNIFDSTRLSSSVAQTVARLYAGVLLRLHRNREAKQVVARATAFHAK